MINRGNAGRRLLDVGWGRGGEAVWAIRVLGMRLAWGVQEQKPRAV